jgi:hypothetical protein
MSYATTEDLLQVEPTITDYGVIDWDIELARSTNEVNRILKVRWFPIYKTNVATNIQFDSSLLDPEQWTQATIYHALGYHICPKLSKFEAEGQEDTFQVKMAYYSQRFETELDLCLREGVSYDLDDNGTITVEEEQSLQSLRLVR